jgi:EAL domain-containing protein (putative c-di-GMP-specific phosphodiesterase class I)
MDGMLNNLKDVIAETNVDIIEAFTPPPTGNLSLKEARSLWKNKVIWLNFTSSIHTCPPEEIRTHTINLLQEAIPGDRLLVGITENVPEDVLERSLKTISQTLYEKGVLPL